MKYQWKDKKPNTQAGSKRAILLPPGNFNHEVILI